MAATCQHYTLNDLRSDTMLEKQTFPNNLNLNRIRRVFRTWSCRVLFRQKVVLLRAGDNLCRSVNVETRADFLCLLENEFEAARSERCSR